MQLVCAVKWPCVTSQNAANVLNLQPAHLGTLSLSIGLPSFDALTLANLNSIFQLQMEGKAKRKGSHHPPQDIKLPISLHEPIETEYLYLKLKELHRRMHETNFFQSSKATTLLLPLKRGGHDVNPILITSRFNGALHLAKDHRKQRCELWSANTLEAGKISVII